MKTQINPLMLTPNAIKVLEKRYLKKDEEGILIEKPKDMFSRVAKHIAIVDSLYGKSEYEVSILEEKFYSLMSSLEFLPNSPTLMNAGRRLGQLSACFVLPIEDSMESIFDAVKNAAIIHKSGGGTGFSFSRLRPSSDIVGSTKGVSSGPISFMTVFDAATEAVKQGGTRRGANMGLLRVDHPNILEFITCKDNDGKLNNFNISVGLTEIFMDAVIGRKEYDLVNPRSKKVVKRLKAADVFDIIVNQAWKNGEPGIVFLDRVNDKNPTPGVAEIESTNPCGEQPLLPYESCNLGSINLAKMSKILETGKCGIDWQKLKDTTHLAVHFLDNVIDTNKYPLKIIEENTKANRKIGLGVMGWADMLVQLGIPYNSNDAINLAEKVMSLIQNEGRLKSEELGRQRGVFPNWSKSIYKNAVPIRNATITTIAPTGTLSIITGCSSGIEPLFALSFTRNVLEGTKLIETNPYFENTMKLHGIWDNNIIEEISKTGSIAKMENIQDGIKKIFVTAHDITPFDHIKMQSAFQKYTDNAVSKTVNFPHSASREDIRDVYMLAYKLDCKGVTIYRDGSRDHQVLSTSKKIKPVQREANAVISNEIKIIPKKRPSVIKGSTFLMKTGCGNLYVTINQDEDSKPFEIFTNIGKAGGCASSQSEAIGRLISLTLRSNIEPTEIITQLKSISCHQPAWDEGGKILSCSDAIAKAIEKFLSERFPSSNGKPKQRKPLLMGACPECGGIVEHEGGCAVCHDCGFTKCL